jgi:hypothetical protein
MMALWNFCTLKSSMLVSDFSAFSVKTFLKHRKVPTWRCNCVSLPPVQPARTTLGSFALEYICPLTRPNHETRSSQRSSAAMPQLPKQENLAIKKKRSGRVLAALFLLHHPLTLQGLRLLVFSLPDAAARAAGGDTGEAKPRLNVRTLEPWNAAYESGFLLEAARAGRVLYFQSKLTSKKRGGGSLSKINDTMRVPYLSR